jgi:hypothetical protein
MDHRDGTTVSIGPVRVTPEDESTLIEADVGWGEACYPLWIRVPGVIDARDTLADVFLPLAVFPALRSGGVLRSAGAISPMLAESITEVQSIFTAWYPGEFRRFALEAPLRHREAKTRPGAASCFTGGVDSFHTVTGHRRELTSLLFAHGLDIPLEEAEFLGMVSSRLREAAGDLGLPLLEPESNFRTILDASGLWLEHTHGAAIASMALALAPEHFSTLYVPSSHGYRFMGPRGSHPMLDPRWSTEYLQIRHDSFGVNRARKTAAIASSEEARRYLRVCWQSRSDYNCGVCEKCTRTMIALDLAGVLDEFETFPDELDLNRVRNLRLDEISKIGLVQDCLDLAEDRPEKAELAAALRIAITEGEALARKKSYSQLARLASRAGDRRFAIDELWRHSTREMLARMPGAVLSKFRR